MTQVSHGDLATVNMKTHHIFVNVGCCDDQKTKIDESRMVHVRVGAFINTRKLKEGDILRVRAPERNTHMFTSEMSITTVQPPTKKGSCVRGSLHSRSAV